MHAVLCASTREPHNVDQQARSGSNPSKEREKDSPNQQLQQQQYHLNCFGLFTLHLSFRPSLSPFLHTHTRTLRTQAFYFLSVILFSASFPNTTAFAKLIYTFFSYRDMLWHVYFMGRNARRPVLHFSQYAIIILH